ncbi:MAG: bifunctional [glutamate--ammonia ligase]-adenylyl-L-tyrosine phosphorylase/[glutamate--ammonia-ligase] adenylyltransferase [Deltaproteobacteria bacterium]|jgi:glutamate-ammonia-ligase adenylyltransferase|nr:bifunctional [glutamate--ammonia ligase]-adenylyl-L-tyrosine phosphorylase/[glutamate--ammonia-ligase] adenylyltransferase [Deltaproteobacteria bacterium]
MTIITDLPDILKKDLETKWEAFKNSSEKAGIHLPQNPQILSALQRVLALSNFVAENGIRNPALISDLIDSGDLQRRYAPEDYHQKLKTILCDTTDEAALNRNLRTFRRREMLRIAFRDLCGWSDLGKTVTDLSTLADTCLAQTAAILTTWLSGRYGVPVSENGSRQDLVILGLGKLGAGELNFSSDIDLIFTYPRSGRTTGSTQSVSNDDFFTRLGRQLIKVLSQPTDDGIVFRTDLRLRPYGENGPLVMHFDAMENYYQEQGREWERYALIRARVVAGDQKAGNQLLKRLNPFIYRRYLDYGAFDSLREMKQMISLEVQRKGMKHNIKLGRGGIREIEFFCHVFQLIRGGVMPALQERSIQKVLSILVRQNHIPREVGDAFRTAYVFLRDTEHRLQEFADQQTHNLPTTPADLARLAAAMGFSDSTEFMRQLEIHRNSVHRHFQMLLEAKDADTDRQTVENQLLGIWQGLVSDVQAEAVLTAVGFGQPQEVLRLLNYLSNALGVNQIGSKGQQRLEKLIPQVLKTVGGANHPERVLSRIFDLLKSIGGRISYLALLLENPDALTHLVRLTEASPWIASFLALHPVLLDELLDPRTLYRPPDIKQIKVDLMRRMHGGLADDLEHQIEQMCVFKEINVLRVAAADVTGALPLMRVSDHLSGIAETVLAEVVNIAYDHLLAQHGAPHCELNGKRGDSGFAVIAYGKLGGLELGYGSDLDLVFLHSGRGEKTKGGQQAIDSAQFYNRLGQRVIHMLTTHTRAGKLYEIDMRLRPSGGSGVLVSYAEGFRDYQLNQAWTWEHQALIKARPIFGDPLLIDHFTETRNAALARQRKRRELQQEVTRMRNRMRQELLKPEAGIFDLKQDTGGMVDIEFLVQYLVLLKSHAYPALLQWTDNVRLIQTLITTGAIDEYTAHILKHAYLIYRAAAHQASLQEKPAKAPEEKFSHLRRRVEKIWNSFLG